MRSWWFLAVALLAGCSLAPAPTQITRIVLSRSECSGRCRFAQYQLTPGGHVSENTGLSFTWDGTLGVKTYQDLTQRLVRLPAFGPRSDYRVNADRPITTIWIEAQQRHWQVLFPTGAARGDARALDRWASLTALLSNQAITRARRPFIARLQRLNDLRVVVFHSNGCYGRCPAYVATFYADGHATLQNPRYVEGAIANSTAAVPFPRVAALLANSNFATLQPQYPVEAVDTYGVSFEFDYRGGLQYTVSAPDSTAWSPQVAALAGAFGQLVRDSTWRATPHVSIR